MTEHSTPSSPPEVMPPDRSMRILLVLRRIARAAALLTAACVLLLAASFLFFRFVILPNLDRVRPYLAQTLSERSGMRIEVGRIDGEWQWWAPVFTLRDLTVVVRPQAPAIRLSKVVVVPAWKSWLHLEPRLASLRLDDLQLALRRDSAGRFSLNGIDLSSSAHGGDNGALDWLLRQDHILLSLRQLSWHDQMLGLPPLQLHGLQLQLADGWRGHRLHVQGLADSSVLPGLTLDADWRGDGVAQWRQWHGQLQLAAGSGELSLLKRYWPQAPFAGQGRVSSHLNADFSAGRITLLQGRWQVDDVALALQRRDLPLPQLAGELDYRSSEPGEHRLQARHLTLSGEFGPLLRDASLDASWNDVRGGELKLSRLSPGALWPVLQQRLPALQALPLSLSGGELSQLRWQWQGPLQQPHDYRLSSAFHQLHPQWGAMPQWQGALDGELSLGRDGGNVRINGERLALSWPGQFKQPLALQQLAGNLAWQRQGDGWQISLPALRVLTPDFDASIDGRWQLPARGALRGELAVRLPQVGIARISQYLPQVIGGQTQAWLQQALQAGVARQVRAVVQGDFSRFPFAGGQGGHFDVDAELGGGQLQFDKAWPLISAINGHFTMRNDTIEINAAQAQTAGVALHAVKVRLPQMMSGAQLLIDGQASGALPRMLAYTRASPVDGWLDGFLSTLDSSGPAALTLALRIPLDQPQQSRVDGEVKLQGNRVQLQGLPLPPLQAVSGVLHFNERGISSPGIDFSAFGGQAQLQATQPASGPTRFTVQGEAAMAPLLQQYVPLLSPLIAGKTPYRADFSIGHTLEQLQLALSLRGTTISAPAPLAKSADEEWPLQLQLQPGLRGWDLHWQQQQRAQGTVAMDEHGTLRGVGVGVGVAAPEAAHAIAIAVQQPSLVLLPWLGAVQQVIAANPVGSGGDNLPLQLQLNTPLLQLGPYRLHDVDSRLDWAGAAAPLQLHWQSSEAEGLLSYALQGSGDVQARLSRLQLPLPEQDKAGADSAATGSATDSNDSMAVPALDLSVARLFWEQRLLGQLLLKAQARGTQWQLDKVMLDMEEGQMQVTGVTPREGEQPQQTEVDVQFDASDAGAVLGRFGMADTLLGGKGRLGGHLSWPGRLRDFDLARLNGALKLDLRNGRFSQVNPGAARLLGILSLQSLSRRMRLDFTDVFSSGFAFDAITGNATVQHGVFASDDLRMAGPAAQVALRGEADLSHNQQQVLARITPNVSESVSLLTGATLVNPMLGALTLLTQKALQDPINKVFSFEYLISGSLTDPQVSKVGESVEARLPSKTP